MNITITRADLQNLEDIEKIETNLEHRILSYTTLSSTLIKNAYYYFIAKIDDTVVGYLAAEFLVDHFDLLAIAVDKNYRRQNIATHLLNSLFNESRKLNISSIFLEVRQSNLSAISLYHNAGFEKINTRKNYYSDTNEHAHIYVKVVWLSHTTSL